MHRVVRSTEPSDEIIMHFENLSTTTAPKDDELDPFVLVPLSVAKSALTMFKHSREIQKYNHSAIQDTCNGFVHKQSIVTNDEGIMHNTQQNREEQTSNNTTQTICAEKQITSNMCEVCGDKAGLHRYYGGKSCTSCRAFFRRHVKKRSRQVQKFIHT